MTDTTYAIDSSGELVAYSDAFKGITEEDVTKAEILEAEIINAAGQISAGYLKIAKKLHEFKEDKYYLALGYESFRAWADSPNLKGIGYRTAHDLIRIYTDIVPILARHEALDALPFVQSGKMRAILPILGDEDAEQKIIDAVYTVKDLTTKDSYAAINEIRGKKDFYDDDLDTVFKAKVFYGESYHKVIVTAVNNDDVYQVGMLQIKLKDWPRWEQRFGRFIEIA
jgi:hypothetical protein